MLKKINPKQTHIRIFLYLGLVCTVFIMIFSLILTWQFSNYAYKEIDGFMKHRIEQLQINTEFTMGRIRTYAFRMYEDKDIKNWLTSKSDNSVLQNELMKSVSRHLSTEPFIHSLYLINLNIDKIIDTKHGVSNLKEFSDQELLKHIRPSPPKYSYFFLHEVGNSSYLVLIVPASISGQKYNSYLVVLLDKAMLHKYLLLLNNDTHSDVIIADADGNQILGNDNAGLMDSIIRKDGVEKNRTFTWKHHSKEWSVISKKLDKEGWTIYHFTPSDAWKGNVLKLQKIIILTSFIMIICLLIILYRNSTKNYKPFTELVKQVQTLAGREPARHESSNSGTREYEIIKRGFDSLIDKTQQLDRIVKDNQYIVKEEYIKRWILNGTLTDPVRQYIKQETSLLDFENVYLAVIRINKYSAFCEKYDYESRKLLKFAIGNIAREILANNGWESESTDFGLDHNVMILTKAAESVIPVTQTLEEVKGQILKWLDINSVISVSSSKNLDEDLHSVYENIYNISTLNFICGEDRIYVEGETMGLESAESNTRYVEVLSRLIQSVRSRDIDAAKSCLDNLIEILHGLNYNECKLQLTHIIYSIMKAFHQMEAVQGFDDIQACLGKMSTLMEVRDWLEKQLEKIVENLNSFGVTSRKKGLVSDIKEYVNNHFYDPGLTIDEIAGYMSLSTNYVRQIFKEVTGTSLSDFIVEQRLHHATNMLRTTEWTISDISEQTGFQTRSHFFKIFKKYMGVTPNQYRLDNKQ